MRRLRFSAGSWYFHDSQPVTSSSGPNTDSGTRGSIGPSGSSQNTTAAIDSSDTGQQQEEARTRASRSPRQASRFLPRRYSASNPAAASPPATRKKRSASGMNPRPTSTAQAIRMGRALPYSTISKASAPTA